MKIRVISIITAMLLLLSGCSQTKQSMQEQPIETESITGETLAENNEDGVEKVTPIETLEENGQATEDVSDLAEAGNAEVALITLEQPPFEYYASEEVTAKENVPLTLNLLSEKANEITDDDRWFADNGLMYPSYEVPNPFQQTFGNLPEGIEDNNGGLMLTEAFSDDAYVYGIYGMDFSDGFLMNIYKADTMEKVYALDFTNYCYAPDYVDADYDYIKERINWATIRDNVLYVSTGHNTYAKSSMNENAYITAIDLSDMHIIWRTDALVDNAYNFQIVGNVIISGYGFTEEPDYLYQIDIFTGKVLDKVELASAPSYLLIKDSILYVRTYNKDYQFEIVS